MEKNGFTIKALDLSTWDAFATLVEDNGGIFGGCWCMGFHPEETTHLDAAQPHREQKLDRVRAGTAHASLVFDGDNCVGWYQFGPPGEVPSAAQGAPIGQKNSDSMARKRDMRRLDT